ncbi:MAG TPA: hypothetical protein VF787_27760 [Thermoanaerobaculia bacterium]
MRELIDRIDQIIDFPELSRDLAAGLDLIQPGGGEAELDALITRVEGRFETSPNYAVVLQFLQDHSRLTDRQLIRLFEFIYSKLVNKFKGELGEVLAARTIFEFGDGREVLHGSRISARQVNGRRGWYDAADALYCNRDGDIFEFTAIAEVKSKATPYAELREQVAKNILRLRRGLRVRGEEIAPERIRIRAASGETIGARDVDEAFARNVTALLILPWKSAADGVPVRHAEHSHIWLAELPYSQDEITECAYRFMSWYFTRVAPTSHAFMEAIYHSALRPSFNPREVAQPGRRTAWQTLLWIYNSLGFTYEEATTDNLMFPEFTPDPQHEAWLERHNAMLAEYRSGNIAKALELFPDPAQQTYAAWAPREWIALARLRARIGDAAGARAALANLNGDPSGSESLSTRMEFAAVQTLIAIAEGCDAERALDTATAVLDQMRDLVRTHEANDWGFPANLTPRNAQEAVIDLAVANVLLDRRDVALELLLRLRGLEEATLELFANDEVLSRITRDGDTMQRLRAETTRRSGLAIF